MKKQPLTETQLQRISAEVNQWAKAHKIECTVSTDVSEGKIKVLSPGINLNEKVLTDLARITGGLTAYLKRSGTKVGLYIS